MRTTTAIILVLAIILTATTAVAIRPVKPVFLFAYADSSGTRLLTPGLETGDLDPGRFDAALGEGGKLFTVTYTGKQAGTDPNQIAGRFANNAGHLYRITDGKVRENSSLLLIRRADHPAAALAPCTPGGNAPEKDPGQLKKLSGTFGRKITTAWLLATGADGSRLHLVLYERNKSGALAALAWTRGGKTLFHAMPGRDDPGSTWRVDDGGEIGPDAFTVLCLLRSPFFALAWDGAEGQSLMVFSAQDGTLKEVARAARYWGAL